MENRHPSREDGGLPCAAHCSVLEGPAKGGLIGAPRIAAYALTGRPGRPTPWQGRRQILRTAGVPTARPATQARPAPACRRQGIHSSQGQSPSSASPRNQLL